MINKVTKTVALIFVAILMANCAHSNKEQKNNDHKTKVIQAQNCAPSNMIGVELKSGREDKGIPYYDDIAFGIKGKVLVKMLRNLNVNNVRVPIMTKIRPEKRADVIVKFIKKIYDGGGNDIEIILSVRKYNLIVKKQQKSWSEDVAYVFNELKKAKLDHMVVGCSFDENAQLKDKQSTKFMWDKRHQGVLESMDRLNKLTGDAFKTRTVFIHGKGLGSQFRGVKASSDSMDFPKQMKKRAANYCYNFKFFATGFPKEVSIKGWEDQLMNYCGLKEVVQLGVPLIYVGDAGDGIRGTGFDPNTTIYSKCGPNIMPALVKVFSENGWTGFSIGVFFATNATMARTCLYEVKDGKAIPMKEPLKCWKIWEEKMEKAKRSSQQKN